MSQSNKVQTDITKVTITKGDDQNVEIESSEDSSQVNSGDSVEVDTTATETDAVVGGLASHCYTSDPDGQPNCLVSPQPIAPSHLYKKENLDQNYYIVSVFNRTMKLAISGDKTGAGSVKTNISFDTSKQVKWRFTKASDDPDVFYIRANLLNKIGKPYVSLSCMNNTLQAVPYKWVGQTQKWKIIRALNSKGRGINSSVIIRCQGAGKKILKAVSKEVGASLALASWDTSVDAKGVIKNNYAKKRWLIEPQFNDATIENNKVWKDTEGNKIQASAGGKMSYIEGQWYWVGSDDTTIEGVEQINLYRSSSLGTIGKSAFKLVTRIEEVDLKKQEGKHAHNCSIVKKDDGSGFLYHVICKHGNWYKSSKIDSGWIVNEDIKQHYLNEWGDNIDIFTGLKSVEGDENYRNYVARYKTGGSSVFIGKDHKLYWLVSRRCVSENSEPTTACRSECQVQCAHTGGKPAQMCGKKENDVYQCNKEPRYVAIWNIAPDFKTLSMNRWFPLANIEALWMMERKTGDTNYYYLCGSEAHGWRPSRMLCEFAKNLADFKGDFHDNEDHKFSVEFRGTDNFPLDIDGQRNDFIHRSFATQPRYIQYVGQDISNNERWIFGGDRYPGQDPNIWNAEFGSHVRAPVIWEAQASGPDKPYPLWKQKWNVSFFDWKHEKKGDHFERKQWTGDLGIPICGDQICQRGIESANNPQKTSKGYENNWGVDRCPKDCGVWTIGHEHFDPTSDVPFP